MGNKKTEPIRIAQIMGKWLGGGVESVVMNYYRHIDRTKIQFDFICDSDSTDISYEEIEKLGGRVILIPPYQHIFKYNKELLKVFKENNYKIVHSNINTLSVFPLRIAKKANIPVRIAHSHSTANKKELIINIMKQILRPLSKIYSNEYFACTEHAGRWLFGNKAFDQGKVTVINNGIEDEKFVNKEKFRDKIKKELKYKNSDIVIGHVGRFMKQKNHDFIIDVFNELHQKDKNYKLMLVGQGPLMDKIKEKVNNLVLNEYVSFLGQRSDINELYQAMDLFLFPSLYEGLGMVMIEAQCSGLPCIASTEVPEIAKVSDYVFFLKLSRPIKEWVDFVNKSIKYKRETDISDFKKCGYDIKEEAKKLEKYYLKRG